MEYSDEMFAKAHKRRSIFWRNILLIWAIEFDYNFNQLVMIKNNKRQRRPSSKIVAAECNTTAIAQDSRGAHWGYCYGKLSVTIKAVK